MPKEFIYVIVLIIIILLLSNKTFFYQKYETGEDKRMFIPRFSFFYKQNDTAAVFFTLKTEKRLKKEISSYYRDTPDLQNNYKVENKKICRKLSIIKEGA